MTNPVLKIDDVVHQRVRLGIMAAISAAKTVDFGFLRTEMALTDGNLSRHLQVLEEAGYVSVKKTFEGKRPRTWVALTKAGAKALDAEVAALRQIIAGLE